MTEEEIRRIVREEIAAREQELAASMGAALEEFFAEQARLSAPDPGDGPVLADIKAILRGEARE